MIHDDGVAVRSSDRTVWPARHRGDACSTGCFAHRSHDGEKVACGSADQIVHVWDVASTEELYYLPGHKGAVTEVDFHPKEPILASSSSDTTVYLGEIA